MRDVEAARWNSMRIVGPGLAAAGLLAFPFVREARIRRAAQPMTEAWRRLPIAPRRSTLLGISFRPPQVDAFGLDARPTFQALLAYPFQIIRLGAYWNRVEAAPGQFDPRELDWQVEDAARAGKQIILAVGALKCFGYPEFYVPAHRLERPLSEGTLICPDAHPALLAAATEFVARIVERYRAHPGVIAWQVENEAVDPLGFEHSWRLAKSFVAREVEAVRQADPSRPILLNGFLPASLLGVLAQWWQTRDQGDSLTVAQRLANLVGIDYYPRYALAAFGGQSMYLDGARSPWAHRRLRQLLESTRQHNQRLIVSEGQAEPWEAMTVPPNPAAKVMYSCPPEQVIATYNACLGWFGADAALYAYVFWGAEYWMLRARSGDTSYLGAFARILEQS